MIYTVSDIYGILKMTILALDHNIKYDSHVYDNLFRIISLMSTKNITFKKL
jgi:hypothetical protein